MGMAMIVSGRISFPVDNNTTSCPQRLCSKGFRLIGADANGCGGECVPAVSDDDTILCPQRLCSKGFRLIGADANGCGGECVKNKQKIGETMEDTQKNDKTNPFRWR